MSERRASDGPIPLSPEAVDELAELLSILDPRAHERDRRAAA